MQNNWTSTHDELPDEDTEVLAIDENQNHLLGFLDDGEFRNSYTGNVVETPIEYWQHLTYPEE